MEDLSNIENLDFVKIPLKGKRGLGQFTYISKKDYQQVKNFTWKIGADGRVVASIKLHKFIMNPPQGMVVDHINGNPLDNRKENLRICTQVQNMQNQKRHKDSISGFKGVSPLRKKWHVTIQVNRHRMHLGSYKTKEEAAHVYDKAAKKYFGEFANLNFK